jgi:membrane-bound lytic murein transglycosylase
MTLPIYDGGSNKARKNENEWRRRGLLSERASLIRNHSSQTQRVISDHRQSVEALKEINAQIAEMEERLISAQAREGQTQSDPLSMARLLSELSQARASHINHIINRELSLLQGVFFADQLGAYIDLPEGEQTC